MGRPVSPKPGLRGPLACFYSEATGNKPHPSQFSVHIRFHHIRELQKSMAATTPNYLLPKCQWDRCLRAGHILLFGTHLVRGALIQHLHHPNHCMLKHSSDPAATVYFLFLLWTFKRLIYSFVLQWDLSLWWSINGHCCSMIQALCWVAVPAGGERLLSRCAGILFPLHKWVPGHQLNCVWHRPLSTICWIETMQFTFLQKRNLTKAKMVEAIKHISIH